MKLPLRILGWMTAVTMLLLTGGCRSSRQAVVTPIPHGGEGDVPMLSLPGFPADAVRLLSASRARTSEWQTLQIPVSLSVSRPKSFSASATLTMVNGRSVDLSVRLLGFEVAAAHIEGDSLKAIVKPSRTYMAESISQVFGGVAVSVADLQALLIGSVINPEPFSLAGAEVTVRPEADGGKAVALMTSGRSFGIGLLFPPQGAELLRIYAAKNGGPECVVGYSDYSKPRGSVSLQLPSEISFDTNLKGTTVEAGLRLNVGRAKFDNPVTPRPLTIPEDYKRVPLRALLKAL
ncbi:MAG: DUF4292 domain-containing protein [Duncaniella sp.]|nr:DUF4292 domain-containing protein [Duncaniella sp.]